MRVREQDIGCGTAAALVAALALGMGGAFGSRAGSLCVSALLAVPVLGSVLAAITAVGVIEEAFTGRTPCHLRCIRAAAARVAGMWESVFLPRHLAPLLRELETAPPDGRASAARELGRLGDPRATLPLAARLADSSPKVRLAVVDALVSLGDRRAVSPILQALERHPDHAEPLMRALGRLGDPLAVPTIIGFLGKPWMPTEHRVAAIQALGRLRDPRAVATLVHALGSESDPVSHAAARALGEIGAPAARALEALTKQQESRRPGPYAEAIRRITAAMQGAPAELEAVPTPEGRGTEPEAAPAPFGHGTELEAAGRSAPTETKRDTTCPSHREKGRAD